MKFVVQFLLATALLCTHHVRHVKAQQIPAELASLVSSIEAERYAVQVQVIEIDHSAVKQAGVELDPLLKSNALQLVDTRQVNEYVAALQQQSVAKELMKPVMVVQSSEMGIFKNDWDVASIDLQFRPVVTGDQCANEFYVDFLTPNGHGARMSRNRAFSYSSLLGQTMLVSSDVAFFGNDTSKTHFLLLSVNRAGANQTTGEAKMISAVAASASSQLPMPYKLTLDVIEIDHHALKMIGVSWDTPPNEGSQQKTLMPADPIRLNPIIEAFIKTSAARRIATPSVTANAREAAKLHLEDGANVWDVDVMPIFNGQSTAISFRIQNTNHASPQPRTRYVETAYEAQIGQSFVFHTGQFLSPGSGDKSHYFVFTLEDTNKAN